MRQYKFRAWDGKKMDYDYRDAYMWNGILVPEGDTLLMLSTGLKDMHGKDIYEGDIMWSTLWPVSKRTKVVIEWTRAEDAQLEMVGFITRDDPGWEIIGNIHENPGLLEKKKGQRHDE